jgi:hypothetical protein
MLGRPPASELRMWGRQPAGGRTGQRGRATGEMRIGRRASVGATG